MAGAADVLCEGFFAAECECQLPHRLCFDSVNVG